MRTESGAARQIVQLDEFVRRMACERPFLFLNADMRVGRIVCEVATEQQFGAHVRRMLAYAMHPHTFEHAVSEAAHRWDCDHRADSHTWQVRHVRGDIAIPIAPPRSASIPAPGSPEFAPDAPCEPRVWLIRP